MNQIAKRLAVLVLILAMLCTQLPVGTLAAVSAPAQTPLRTETITYINPLYADVVTEADLVKPAGDTPLSPAATSESDYADTFAEAGAQIRAALEQRQETVVAYYQTTSYSENDHNEIFLAAAAHTGVPTQGDSLRWGFAGYTVEISGYTSNNIDYLTFTYTMTSYTTAQQEAELDAAVDALLTELALENAGTYEKIRGVYDYICANVTYDYANLDDETYTLKYTPYAALLDKTAVCQGYALLMYRLLLELGVDTRLIAGTGNGGAHGWNIVQLGDVYYNADSTWDAGMSSYSYFLKNEANFTANYTDHIRYAEYDTAAFHAAYPMSATDYDTGTEPTPDPEPELPGGTTGSVKWRFDPDSGMLTIFGNGDIPNYSNPTDQPWYDYLDQITSVVIMEGITAVGAYAFEGYSALRSVSLPNGLESVEIDAFKDCTALTELVFPDTVTKIAAWAMQGCTALVRVQLPAGIDTLYGFTFDGCTSLAEVEIPASVTRIINSVFQGCAALKEITIPAAVESIGSLAFADTGLNRIVFLGDPPSMMDHPAYGTFLNVTANACYPADNAAWTADVMSGYGGTLIWYDSSTEPAPLPDPEPGTSGSFGSVYWYMNTDTSVLTISGTGTLGGFSNPTSQPWYAYLDQITGLVVNEGITGLGTYSFEGHTALETVSLPEGLLEVQADVFQGCTALKEIHFPDTVTSISAWAMDGCTSLEKVTLPAGIDMIYAFTCAGCTSLTQVNIPDGVTTIKNSAFENCSALKQIVIPASVESIDMLAFANSGLEKIYFRGDAPKMLDHSAYGTFLNVTANAYYPQENATWTADIMGDYNGDLTWIPYNGVIEIAGGTFGEDLKWSLGENGVLTISGSGEIPNFTHKAGIPWYGCADQITSVVIEEGVTAIGSFAFYGMPKLETVSIPEGVTSIGLYAFKNCTALVSAPLPEGLTQLGESSFYGCTALASIDIPASLWTVQPYTFKNCTGLKSVTFHEGNLMKIANSAFYNTGLTEVVLPDCLDILDVYTFKNCFDLTSVTLSSSLTEIRVAAFYGTGLTSLDVPEGITKIGAYAFKNCADLAAVNLPESLSSIGDSAFYDTAIAALDIPDAVTTIGSYAFRKCTAMETVTLSDSLVTIGDSSFYGCTGLTALVIPDHVTDVGAYAFKGCSGITALTLGGSVETLGDSAFHSCAGLKAIVFPETLTAIGAYCFSGSYYLGQLTFTGDAPAIGTSAFKTLTATAYYPDGNPTWTSANMLSYGGNITWEAA